MTAKKPADTDKRQWRQMPAEFRRRQLMDATIAVISDVGISKATVGLVAAHAKLSPAIVNLQFGNKNTMLVETFKSMRNDFRDAWVAAQVADVARDNVAMRISNMLQVYFYPEQCSPQKLRVWFAFLGEAAARETYLDITQRYEDNYVRALTDMCADLIAQGGYTHLRAEHIARSLLAACDGLWVARMLRPDTLSPEACRENLAALLAMAFPDHFPASPNSNEDTATA
ncbi:TetR family transcriptional regulator C-terminal domain-containing protein [Roseovarius aestuarii]|nr:TetR family transcriptional regulator C-terminal domain-containing protein [Roseovarius aestuarii]